MQIPSSVLCAVVACFATLPSLAATFSPDQAGGRLPKNVVPDSYVIDIVPDTAAHTLTGRESIVLHVQASTAVIQFNSLNEILHDVRLDGRRVKTVVSSDKDQLTTVTLTTPAPVGTHTLTFTYTGMIETKPQGLFAQPYTTTEGAPGVLLSTQMEATDARRMFPCWDEPAFRATFTLSATVPAAWDTVSNMPVASRVVHGRLATTTFETTPRMPSYLVDFNAGLLGEISATRDGTTFGMWAIRGAQQNGAVALANAQTILADYNDYFGYRFPLPKLDSIAVPGGFQGAMENWGAITYNDQLLLLSAASSIRNRQEVFSVQAHEMAHQWNGDLVTMAWWDDIWLNESFASWMAAKETDLRNPDWRWWEAQDGDKEAAMGADAQAMSHPIRQHVTDELQAANSFDPLITYSKGQAILRMFEAYLRPDVFRAGIRSYMKTLAFSNATTADLWNSLSAASGQDVGSIAAGWTEQAGFPLVDVAVQCDGTGARTLTLTQQRFLLQGHDDAHPHWKIPLQIRSGVAASPRSLLLTQDKQTDVDGRCDEPLSVDAGALGFYRVRYEPATLAINTKNFGKLPNPDRIALLDDQWALVEAGQQPLPTYLALGEAMGTGLDARAWTQIAAALKVIEYDARGSAGHDAIAAYARSVLTPAFDALGWDAKPNETPDLSTLRQTLIRELGACGDPRIIEGARARFAKFLDDRAAIPPDAQEATLAVVAEYADAAMFARLHDVARGAHGDTEARRYYSALMAVRDPVLAREAAQIALSSDIPPQLEALRFELFLSLAADHQELSWSVFKDNSERLLKPFGSDTPLLIGQYIPEYFWNGVPPAELEAWLQSHLPAQMESTRARGMELVRTRLTEKDMLVPAAAAYLKR